MSSRAEITTRYARGYVKVWKADRGRILDQVGEVNDWSRDNARRRLTAAAVPPGAGRQVAKQPRRQRKSKYSYDALKVLQKVWAASGGQCGRYLAASMALQLDALERHGELVCGQDRYRLRCAPSCWRSAAQRSTATCVRPGSATRSRANRPPRPPRCCGLRSRSAKQPTRPRHLRGSSKVTRSRTADQPSKVSSPAPSISPMPISAGFSPARCPTTPTPTSSARSRQLCMKYLTR